MRMPSGSMSVSRNRRLASGRVRRMCVPRRIMAGAKTQGLAAMLAPTGTRMQAQNGLRLHFPRSLDSSRIAVRLESQPRRRRVADPPRIPAYDATQNPHLPPARSDGARAAAVSASAPQTTLTWHSIARSSPPTGGSWPGQASQSSPAPFGASRRHPLGNHVPGWGGVPVRLFDEPHGERHAEPFCPVARRADRRLARPCRARGPPARRPGQRPRVRLLRHRRSRRRSERRIARTQARRGA